MKAADLNILGGLFGDFQQGVNFGRSIQNDNQRRRLAEEENARQEKQLRMQMAQAQVAAEKARQEMQYLPEEMKNKTRDLEIRAGHLKLGERGQDFTEQKHKDDLAQSDTEFRRSNYKSIRDKLRTPNARLALASKPEAFWDTPEGAVEAQRIIAQDEKDYQTLEVKLAGGKATASANALTKAIGERERVKPEAYSKDTANLINSFRDKLTNTTDPSKVGAAESAAIIATQLRSKQRDLQQKAAAYKAKGDTISQMAGARLESEAAAIERTLQNGEQTLQQSLAPTSNPEAPPPARIAQPITPQQLQLLQGNPDEELDPAQFGL